MHIIVQAVDVAALEPIETLLRCTVDGTMPLQHACICQRVLTGMFGIVGKAARQENAATACAENPSPSGHGGRL